METVRLKHYSVIVMIAIMFGFIVSSCNKDTSSAGNTMSALQLAAVQNSDVQDAVADKSEQDIDKTLDELQSNNYNTSAAKSESAKGTRTIIVDHPDSTTFPKIVTIIYSNYQDSTADESFVRNGEIDIVVTEGATPQLITRAFTFKGYSVTTDSTTVAVTGTRTVERTAFTHKLTGLASLRLSFSDNITANLRFAIIKTGETDSLIFTRVVSKLRTSVLHYDNVGGNSWLTIRFRNDLSKDTITFSGTVTGVNEKGDNYTKTVSSGTPLTVIFYRGTPVISSGTMDLTIAGETADSFTITYKEDLPNHPHKTLVTVTNNLTNATHSFDRIFGRKFLRWW
jgi:hypothetical protein